MSTFLHLACPTFIFRYFLNLDMFTPISRSGGFLKWKNALFLVHLQTHGMTLWWWVDQPHTPFCTASLLYPTALTSPQPPTTPPCLFTSPPPPRLLREAAPCIPKPPATQTISHACQTASNSITDHATNMSCIISMLLLLHLIHPSPNSSPPPPPAPQILITPQTHQNSHLTQPPQHNEQ